MDNSTKNLKTFAVAAGTTALLVGTFKLFSKTKPQLMSPCEEKGFIFGGVSTCSALCAMFSAAGRKSSVAPLGIFVGGLLTSVVIDRLVE